MYFSPQKENMKITNAFQAFDPLKDDVNTVLDLSGNYIFVLREKCKLPDVGIPVTYTKFRGYDVIYVGLAGKSLRDRDIKKHFKGNAGGSTLRKSLGCLFGYNLIPRDSNYSNNGKTKFDATDERELSDWIKANLLFFYYANKDYDVVESLLIRELNPPLNLDKNSNIINSEFREYLTKLRSNKPKQLNNIMERSHGILGKELYVQIWADCLPKILSAIKCNQGLIALDSDLFESVGNRKNSGYSFHLDIDNGIVPRKSGSAVARDLKKVLDGSSEFRMLAKGKKIMIRLNVNFELIVQVI